MAEKFQIWVTYWGGSDKHGLEKTGQSELVFESESFHATQGFILELSLYARDIGFMMTEFKALTKERLTTCHSLMKIAPIGVCILIPKNANIPSRVYSARIVESE